MVPEALADLIQTFKGYFFEIVPFDPHGFRQKGQTVPLPVHLFSRVDQVSDRPHGSGDERPIPAIDFNGLNPGSRIGGRNTLEDENADRGFKRSAAGARHAADLINRFRNEAVVGERGFQAHMRGEVEHRRDGERMRVRFSKLRCKKEQSRLEPDDFTHGDGAVSENPSGPFGPVGEEIPNDRFIEESPGRRETKDFFG